MEACLVTNLKGFRTLLLNAATFVTLLVAAIMGEFSDPEMLRILVLVNTVGNVLLRFLTKGPVGGGTV